MIFRVFAVMILALPWSFASCNRSREKSDAEGSLAIYALQDTALTVEEVAKQDLGALVLATTPLLTVGDIAAYSWPQQSFSVKPALQSHLTALGKKPYKSGGIPFVATVGDERIYLGAFWYSYSSSYPRVPYIVLPSVGSLELEFFETPGVIDPRRDRRVHDALKKAGVLME